MRQVFEVKQTDQGKNCLFVSSEPFGEGFGATYKPEEVFGQAQSLYEGHSCSQIEGFELLKGFDEYEEEDKEHIYGYELQGLQVNDGILYLHLKDPEGLDDSDVESSDALEYNIIAVVKSPEAIDSLDIPQVGVLPKVAKLKRGFHILQMFLEDSESNFSESIRSSRAIIESKFKKNSSYMVTSSNPSEGKTTYAFNLALSLEKTNKVLFIEADIRRPSVLNSFYQFDKEIHGLGEIISGSHELKETIFKVPGTNLDIITSGEKRFDMSDIVNKEQIKKFLDILKMEYDYVIIDSPPVQPVSDTLILAQATDYNLFLIRSEATRTVTFMSSIKKIQNVGSKIHGIIINDLDTSKDSYYAYYYNYSPYYYNYYNYYNNKNS